MPTEKEKKKIIVKLIIESKRMRTRPDNRNLKKTGANHPRCNLDIEFVNVSPFFLFRLSQSAAARLSSHFTPPYHHIPPPTRTDDDIPLSYSSPGQRRNCLGPGCEATGNERQEDERQHFHPPREKENDDDILEGNASIHHVLFFLFHVHLHGNVT